MRLQGPHSHGGLHAEQMSWQSYRPCNAEPHPPAVMPSQELWDSRDTVAKLRPCQDQVLVKLQHLLVMFAHWEPLMPLYGRHNSCENHELMGGSSSASITSDNPFDVPQAQECGEQFQLQDDIQYALDGLCASALPSDRASSAAQLAEIAATRRGRLALRSDWTPCELANPAA